MEEDPIDELLEKNFKEALNESKLYIEQARKKAGKDKASGVFLLFSGAYGQLPSHLKKNYGAVYTDLWQDLEFLLELSQLQGSLNEAEQIREDHKELLEKRLWDAYKRMPLEKRRIYDKMYEEMKEEIKGVAFNKRKKWFTPFSKY